MYFTSIWNKLLQLELNSLNPDSLELHHWFQIQGDPKKMRPINI